MTRPTTELRELNVVATPNSRNFGSVVGLVLLAVVAMALTLVVSLRVFPSGSPNLDEVAYEAQARAMTHGQLLLPAEDVSPGFAPYLSGHNDDGDVVFKYQPLWPALIAGSLVTTGSTLPIRLILSGAGVLAVAWFAHELIGSRRVALVAAAICVASPFTWLLSATVLGYHLSFVLVAAAGAALLRTERRLTLGAAVLAGVFVGAAVLHRPFDSLLALGPVVAIVGWRAWCERRAPSLVLGVILGGLPFAVVLGWVNTVVMGAPWQLPFNAGGGIDGFGFGWRASFVTPTMTRAQQVHYTPGRALSSQWSSLVRLFSVVVAAPITVVVAGWACWRHRDRRVLILVAMCLSVLVGYTFWWGTYNLAMFGLDRSMGPVYHYPLLLPLAVAAAWGLCDLWDRRPVSVTLRVAAVAAAVTVTAPLWWGTVDRANRDGESRRQEVAALTPASPSLGLHPVASTVDPYVRVANEPDLSGPHVYGVDLPERRLDNVLSFGDRGVVVVRNLHTLDDLFGPQQTVRNEVHLVRGTRLRFAGDQQGATAVTIDVADLADGETLTAIVALDRHATVSDPDVADVQLRWPVRRIGNELVTLDMADSFQYYDFGDRGTSLTSTDVSAVLSATVSLD